MFQNFAKHIEDFNLSFMTLNMENATHTKKLAILSNLRINSKCILGIADNIHVMKLLKFKKYWFDQNVSQDFNIAENFLLPTKRRQLLLLSNSNTSQWQTNLKRHKNHLPYWIVESDRSGIHFHLLCSEKPLHFIKYNFIKPKVNNWTKSFFNLKMSIPK